MKIASWTIIALWLTHSIFFRIINIDFSSIEIARNFRQIWLILIPLAVGSLVVNTWKGRKPGLQDIIKLTLGICISVCLILVLNFLSSFCEWQFSEPLYKHKSEMVEIRQRYIDCGAWDSEQTYQLVETYSIGNYLIKYSDINKEDINSEKWIKK